MKRVLIFTLLSFVSLTLFAETFVEISEPCTVYCYGVSSDGYISYNNMYVVKDSYSSSSISTPFVDNNKEDRYYNLQGQRVHNPKNGIYVVNGKKVFIK